VALQSRLKSLYDSQAYEMKKNYESMAASNQSQVEMLQDKIISEFCEKAGQIARLAIQQAKGSKEI
jgi:flagellin-specific chaperone FliS